jgi:hypothetical protein
MSFSRVGPWPCFAAAAILAASAPSVVACPPLPCMGGPTLDLVAKESGLVAEAEIERIYTPLSFLIQQGLLAVSATVAEGLEKIDRGLGYVAYQGLMKLGRHFDGAELEIDLRIERVYHGVAKSERISVLYWRGAPCPFIAEGKRGIFFLFESDGKWIFSLVEPVTQGEPDASQIEAVLRGEAPPAALRLAFR